MPKGPLVVCTSTQDINSNVGNFHVPAPKEMKDCKELAEVSSPNKQITSPCLPKSKSYIVINVVIMKKLKLVKQDVAE
jgi:hypothetical protein